tara:strand:- start:154 stop:375 length:222 start_codon:yes stop_codon:yes gene_type:complete
MSSQISQGVMKLVDEVAEWFGEEMMRLEERDMSKYPHDRDQRLREHTVIAKSNIAGLLDDIRRERQSGKKRNR